MVCGRGAISSAQGPSQIFENPPAVSSENGHLEVDLTAQAGEFRIGGRRFQGLLYNGAYVPPVWKVRAGDSLVVAPHKRLDEATNLHFHGLDVSPAGNGDNVFLHIKPRWRVHISDQDSAETRRSILVPSAHARRCRSPDHRRHVSAIVVEGSDRLYPFLRKLPGRVILFKHRPVGRPDYQELVTVNGLVAPRFPIRPGEAQFWIMGNIGADRFLRVKICGMPFYIIGRDGYFLPEPIRVDEAILGPGQRVSAIVVGAEPGSYAFKSVSFRFDDQQLPLPELGLGTIVSRGPTADVAAIERRVSSPTCHHAALC